MPPKTEPAAIQRFGAFELDLRSGELRKKGVRIKLQEQPFQVLGVLLRHPGEVVTREELRSEIWSADTFVDFDNGLNTSINKLREALGDSADGPRFIETLPRRGYRFIAPISSDEGKALGKQTHIRIIVAAAVVVAITAVAAAYVGLRRFRPPESVPAGRIMLAVLPFENLSGDPAQDYLSDGFTEETITELGQLNPARLGVIARTSSTAYKNTRKTTAEIGLELGVNYILEGSLRRAGNRVRISAQLIEVKGQTHVWAQDYDRELRDLLAVQDEVAQAIAQRIQLELTLPSAGLLISRRPVNQDANEAYLRGRYFWNKRNPQGFVAAERYFQQAIEKDPGFGPAYAGLADTYLLVGGYSYRPQAETVPQAKAAAQKALTLDSTLAEPHASLGLMAMNYDWDWAEAERQFKWAIQINSNYATAHHWYAEYLYALGRFEEGFAQMQLAQELDPASVIIQSDAGKLFFLARQNDLATTHLRKALEMDPNFGYAHAWLACTMIQKRQFEESLAEVRSLQRLDDSFLPPALLGQTYAAMGKKAEALAAIEESRRRVKRGPMDPGRWAVVYAQLGDKDRAFALLEQAYRSRGVAMTSLKVNPEYDPLRSDPRFTDLLRRVGLAQ